MAPDSLTFVPNRPTRTGHGPGGFPRQSPDPGTSAGLTAPTPSAYRTEADLVAGAVRSCAGQSTPRSPLDS